jgi:hypothetical protein
VSRYVGTQLWKGGGISLYYAGHGAECTGAMVFKDGDVSGTQLAEMVAGGIMSDRYSRGDLLGIELAMDSCFAGAFLAEFLAAADSPEMKAKLLPRDMWAASLHDESAWELPELGHGVLTYTFKNVGNGYVDMQQLAQAVDRNDQQFLRMALQGHVPNRVTFLTEGDQHAIELVNGHQMEVKGAGYFELPIDEPCSADQLKDALERCRDAGHGEMVHLSST